MAKYYGTIGFVSTQETPPGSGVWEDVVVERTYKGDVTRNSKRWDQTQGVNDDLNISNTISIVADPYASENLFSIRYIRWLGGYWKITNVEVQYPRLILSIGGVYNGPKIGTSGASGEHPGF